MIHTHTQETVVGLVNNLMDSHSDSPERPIRFFRGSYIGQIEDANKKISDRWKQHFDTEYELPDYITEAGYTLGDKKDEVNNLLFDIANSLPRYRELCNKKSLNDEAIEGIREEAAFIRQSSLASLLNYKELRPNLTLSEKIINPPVPYRRSSPHACCVSVFMGNVLSVIPEDYLNLDDFNPWPIMKTIRNHSTYRPGSASEFDLSWLIGLMQTDYFEEISGKSVRSIVSLGADLGNIENDIIKPLRQKDDKIGFIINTVVSSQSGYAANHALSLVGADGEKIMTKDPNQYNEKVKSVNTLDFWNRWIKTNMQAIITIIRPK